jgi:hypothetical protein
LSVWDPGAPRTNNGMAMARVIATNGHAPIVRLIRDEIVPGTRVRAPPAKGGVQRETLRLSYEAANLDQAQAKLTVRRGETDPRREIPPSGWTYAGPRQIALLPDSARPEAGAIYEFHYPAKNPAVLGIGFAATRDLISFLRREKATAAGQDNPAGAGIRTALAYGSSQSGRYLRDFVHLGFNQDESAREANGDPRLSLEERYGDHAGYVERLVAAVDRLVADRLLLREDAGQIIARAKSAEAAKLFTR